jgi:fermentation-respiration switch protein FrsA (DUF1100 family)
MIVILVTAAVGYAGFCLLVFLVQGRLVYFPGPPPTSTPEAHGLEYRELELATSDGVTVHGWYLPAENARGALLFCHGNAGNIEHRLYPARVFHELGLAVLLFDYRGYGKSTGEPSEEGTYRDAEAAYDFLAAEGFMPKGIVLYGESLGGGVAIELAGRRQVAGVAVESTFTSVTNLGAELYRWLPVRLLSRFRYDNAAKVASLGVPLLVAHSPDDELIPYSHGEAVFAAAAEPKIFLATGGGHNSGGFLQRPGWVDVVREFLLGVLP